MRREPKRGGVGTKLPLQYRREKMVQRSLARQVEVLYEDNRQLRAAVMIYREVVRKLTGAA